MRYIRLSDGRVKVFLDPEPVTKSQADLTVEKAARERWENLSQAAKYERMAANTNDPELRRYWREKAKELKEDK